LGGGQETAGSSGRWWGKIVIILFFYESISKMALNAKSSEFSGEAAVAETIRIGNTMSFEKGEKRLNSFSRVYRGGR